MNGEPKGKNLDEIIVAVPCKAGKTEGKGREGRGRERKGRRNRIKKTI